MREGPSGEAGELGKVSGQLAVCCNLPGALEKAGERAETAVALYAQQAKVPVLEAAAVVVGEKLHSMWVGESGVLGPREGASGLVVEEGVYLQRLA